MRQAAASAKGLAKEVDANSASILKVSDAATKGGLAIVAGLGLAGKAAMDWESSWAGVTKTVDATSTTSLPQLEGSLRELARTLPATHTEIAGVAEAAGQLGIKADDVAGFTATMIHLGETTNLTAQEAATQLARFSNITGTSASEVDRLGSTLVGLGNSYATTEAEILAMSMRLAAVGTQMGFTEGQTMGLATAMSSVGIEAEAGGTAMSLGMKKIDAAVRTGGSSLDAFARTAGMTSSEFAAAWGSDASGTLARFIEGLGRAGAEGQSMTGILSELGVTGVRESDAFLRLAQAGDLAADAMKRGGDEFSANTALLAEAEKRYETTASKVQVSWNRIMDAAIDAGQYVLPVIAQLAEGAADLASAFSKLPGPVQGTIVGIAGIVGPGLLAVGMMGKLAVSGVETVTALRNIARNAPTVVGGFKKAALAAAGLTVALVALAAVQDANRKSFDGLINKSDELSASLKRGTSLDDIFTLETQGLISGTTTEVDGLGQALQRVLNPGRGEQFEDFMNGLVMGQSAAGQMADQFAELDASLASLASGGNAAAAAKTFDHVAEAARAQGVSMEDLATLFPAYTSALRDSGGAAMQATSGTDLLTDSLDAEAAAAADATAAVREHASALLQLSGSEIGLEAAIDEATASIGENGKTLDINTEKGRANRGALDRIASSALSLRDAQKEAGASTEEMNASTDRARASFVVTARQMGLTAVEASALADDYGLIPATVKTAVSAPGADEAKRKADAFDESVRRLPPSKRTDVVSAFDNRGVVAAKRALDSVKSRTVTITTRHVSNGAPDSWTGGSTKYARGGTVWGAGTATSDSIPAWLSNGEHVMRTWAAQKIGYDRLAFMNATGELPRFAAGGPVRYAPQAPRFAAGGTVSSPMSVSMGDIAVRVFLGDRELTDMVRTEISRADAPLVRDSRLMGV